MIGVMARPARKEWTPAEEVRAAAKDFAAVTPKAIARTVAFPPASWGLPLPHRVAMAQFLWTRHGAVLEALCLQGSVKHS